MEAVAARAEDLTGEEWQQKTLHVSGLDCPDCAGKFEESVKRLDNVKNAALSFAAGKLYIDFRGGLEEVYQMAAARGYQLAEDGREVQAVRDPVKTRAAFVLISLAFLLSAVIAAKFGANFSAAFLLAATASGGFNTFRKAFASFRLRQFDMNVLMTVAVSGALFIGEWWEAAVVAFLFAAGNALETYTAEKNKRSIHALMDAIPEEARLLQEGVPRTVPVAGVRPGDQILIRPGERIPLDGVVTAGGSYVAEAAVTGEPLPTAKKEGEKVFAGTLNGDGSLTVAVTSLASDSTLAGIVKLVEEANTRRAPFQRFVDRFARVYTPSVIILAALIFTVGLAVSAGDWRPWLYRSLALLIVACPCALVVSTPVAVTAALTSAARRGVLIKGGAYLELAGQIRAVVFDKTGTLTSGAPSLQSIEVFNGIDEKEAVRIAASLAAHTGHPLAQAVALHAEAENLALSPVTGFVSYPGKGVAGLLGNTGYIMGSPAFLAEEGVSMDLARRNPASGNSTLCLANSSRLLAVITLSDSLRPGTHHLLNRLRELGIAYLAMLSGDREEAALQTAGGLGLDSVRGGLLPEEKEELVGRIRQRYGKTAMVGDGINDAPALASADLGIAMGVAGSATALETADVALMGDELSRLPYLVTLSRRTIAVIRQNIALSLFIKGLAVILVFPGWLTLWLAILADMGASILVTANGMRLLWAKDVD
jgi:Cd2+/Zn2+-exporting ATPase